MKVVLLLSITPYLEALDQAIVGLPKSREPLQLILINNNKFHSDLATVLDVIESGYDVDVVFIEDLSKFEFYGGKSLEALPYVALSDYTNQGEYVVLTTLDFGERLTKVVYEGIQAVVGGKLVSHHNNGLAAIINDYDGLVSYIDEFTKG